MPSIDDYAADLNLALVDAAADPIFKQFMEPDDVEVTTITLDNGHGIRVQAQAQALARGSIRRVLERILEGARNAGADMRQWICSRSEFNLCAKLCLEWFGLLKCIWPVFRSPEDRVLR
jgi:hypothetical protein